MGLETISYGTTKERNLVGDCFVLSVLIVTVVEVQQAVLTSIWEML